MQSNAALYGSSAAPTATVAATPAVGNLLLCWWVSGSDATLSNSGWTEPLLSRQNVGSALYWKIAGVSEPKTVTFTQRADHCVVGYHEYTGNTSTPFDNSGFAYVYFDSGATSGPSFSMIMGGSHELVFAVEALRYNPGQGSLALTSPAWTGGLGNIINQCDGVSGNTDVAALVGDLLDSGTSTPIAVAPSWSGFDYQERTTMVVTFFSAAGSGVNVSDTDAFSGADAVSSLAVTLSSADQLGHTTFDGGEHITQTGPYPTSDVFTGTDAGGPLVPVSGTDTGSGLDAGTVLTFATVFIVSSDSTQRPATLPVSSDRAQFSESGVV